MFLSAKFFFGGGRGAHLTIDSLNLFGVKLVPPWGMVNENKKGTRSGMSEAKMELMSGLPCLMR